ncbi:hypothetical protein AB0H83_30015 [Dactylosporangium sp. NPDC050688]|uniref:hypothetical protein n=1 Tax=Dactylosporangium sp. NPDC050688 TaxID=3157217 RepID=UPI0033D6C919
MSEDTHVTPAAWRRSVLPRRGGLPVAYRPVAGHDGGAAPGRGGDREPAMEPPRPGGALLLAELDSPASGDRRRRDTSGPPGIVVGEVEAVTQFAEQSLLDAPTVGAGGTRWTRDRPHTFGGLHSVTVSEIIRDLREVVQ